jgi:hypothetical protein
VSANPKDLAILTAATGSVRAASEYLSSVSLDAEDVGVQQHLAALGASLYEEADQLRSMAQQVLAAIQENDDKDDGDSEDVSADNLFAVYDQRNIDDRGADAIKWYNPFTSTGDTSGNSRNTKKRGICFHHTAVKGGFGVHASRRDAWLANGIDWTPTVTMANGVKRETVWPVEANGAAWDAASDEERLQVWARAMALADRYRGYKPGQYNTGVPYHVVRSANLVLVLNLPFDWVTWHGNGSNNWFLGFGWDAHSEYDTFDPANMLADITKTVEIGRAEGHFAEGLEFTGHCAWTNKPTDPGKEFVEFLVDEAAPKLGATIDLDFKSSNSAKSFREVLAS